MKSYICWHHRLLTTAPSMFADILFLPVWCMHSRKAANWLFCLTDQFPMTCHGAGKFYNLFGWNCFQIITILQNTSQIYLTVVFTFQDNVHFVGWWRGHPNTAQNYHCPEKKYCPYSVDRVYETIKHDCIFRC